MSELPQASIDLLRRLNKEGYLALYFDKAVKGGPHEALIKAEYARQVGGFLVASGLGFKAEEDFGRNVLPITTEGHKSQSAFSDGQTAHADASQTKPASN